MGSKSGGEEEGEMGGRRKTRSKRGKREYECKLCLMQQYKLRKS